MREIDDIIIHCTATRKNKHYDVATIRKWHLANGWDDIGYHYVIYIDGSLHVGRPLDIDGAHAFGHNHGSIGICYVDGLNRQGRPANTLNKKQEQTLVTLITALRALFPSAGLHGHNDYSNKECPCFDVSSWWKKYDNQD